MRYKKLEDGQAVEIPVAAHGFEQKVMCCDCGLVHHFYYRRKGGKWYFMAERDETATRRTRARRVRRFAERRSNGKVPATSESPYTL